ncbi:MAG: PHB depolymerase family esterase [Pseudomonadota bacterium]
MVLPMSGGIRRHATLMACLLVSTAGAAASASESTSDAVCGAGGPCVVTGGAYHIALPDDLEPGAALPVLMVLHDTGGDAAALTASPEIAGAALARGVAVIAPTGGQRLLADGEQAAGWALSGTHGGGRHEASFIARVLDNASALFPIDRQRVTVTGFGHGGSLTWQLACDSPWIASAFAPRNGGFHAALPEACAAPVPVLHMHTPVQGGWPLGGEPEAAGETAARIPVQAHLGLAASSFDCGASAAVLGTLPESWDALEWQDCAEGASLGLVLHDERLTTTERQIALILDWVEAVSASAEAPLAATLKGETSTN